jgi:hypothetical protein
MASSTTYFVVEYDNEASGPFTAEGALLTWSGGTGFIVTVVDDGSTGKLQCALVSGVIPTNDEELTQGSTTADTNGPAANGDAELMLYPAYARVDLTVAQGGATTWAGPALGTTHSFLFDGQSTNVVANEILTFSDGQTCEVITVESDAGASGELSVRWISFIDTLGFPDDNDTFSGDQGGDGALNGVVHPRAYTPLHLHRLYSDLNDDPAPAGNDFLAVYDPDASAKDTDQIVRLLNVTINDTVAQHMYGGSVEQDDGDTLYSGWNVQLVDPDGQTAPVLIQDDAIITDYWGNAYSPDSIQGRVRIMLKTREDGVDIDGKRVSGKILRYGHNYFLGTTTLGTAATGLTLFTGVDGNNQTAEGTVAGSPYNTIVIVEGYQEIDFNNGNGATPYSLSFDLGSATKSQAYERWKYISREGTSETLFGRNAQLVTGVNLDFAYDAEASGPFIEDETIAWGCEVPYTAESGGPFTFGNVLVGDTSGARGRIIYLDDQGTTGTIIVALEGATGFDNTEGLTEVSGGAATGATATSGTVVNNTTFGTALLMALDDNGTDGFLYTQQLIGLPPNNNQTIYGATSLATASVDAATSRNSRVINTNLYVGAFTGSDFNPTNFGIALDSSDAGTNDRLVNLLGVQQAPPNNQQGQVTGGSAGDFLAVLPWDGSTLDVNGFAEPDFDEMQLASALTAGVSTSVDVGAGNIPANTPAAGYLLVERDSDSELDLLEYSAHNGDDTFTLVGTAPSAASIGNNVMRALIYGTWATTGVPESYTAVQTSTNQVTITLKRGGVNPIKPSHGTATFGASGFTSAVQRISDV